MLVDINHLLRHSPVDCDILTIDKVIFFLAEKQAHPGDIFRLAYPS